jgi:hypothetical protein
MRQALLIFCAALALAFPFTGQTIHNARPIPKPVITGKVTGVTVVDRVPIPPPASCPFTLSAQATIVVDGPVTVTYHWVRSDSTTAPEGETGPDTTLTFDKESGKMVSNSWALPYSTHGWVYVEIVAPNSMQSRPASFVGKCGPPAPAE